MSDIYSKGAIASNLALFGAKKTIIASQNSGPWEQTYVIIQYRNIGCQLPKKIENKMFRTTGEPNSCLRYKNQLPFMGVPFSALTIREIMFWTTCICCC